MGLPKPKSQLQPRPTVLVRNPLLIRRISKKISEREKKQVKTSNFCPGHASVSYWHQGGVLAWIVPGMKGQVSSK